jgi:hypothetical protein
MKLRPWTLLAATLITAWWGVLVHGQTTAKLSGPGRDFKYPEYYPASNGVLQVKTLISGREAQAVSNNMSLIRLKDTTLTNYSPDGRVEWIVQSPECIVNVAAREVRGTTNMFFQTADEKFFLSGVGFLWQHTNSVLILLDQVSTWIDKNALTNSPLK